jgi:Carboxypeptidase regulatory-like domain
MRIKPWFAFLLLLAAPAQADIIAGRVIDESGKAVAGVLVTAGDLASREGRMTRTDAAGTFHFDLPTATYTIAALPPRPFNPVRRRVTAPRTDLPLIVATGRYAYVADVPPRAALITVSGPDEKGAVVLRGSPGAVDADSDVLAVTLDSGEIAIARARPDGGFELQQFAAAGAHVLLKADPYGQTVACVRGVGSSCGEGNLAPLPGTMLRIPEEVAIGSATPFAMSGTFGPRSLPLWTYAGTIEKTHYASGEAIRAAGKATLTSPVLKTAGTMSGTAHLILERLSGQDVIGGRSQAFFTTTLLTPTGLPIEKSANYSNHSFGFARFAFTRITDDRAEAAVAFDWKIPAAFPDGWYRPRVAFFFENVPVETAPSRVMITVDKFGRRPMNNGYLPLIRIGDPPAPRLPLMLLMDVLTHGTYGVRAREDRERFGLSARFTTQTDTFVVPREDAASGKRVTYRLEPFAPSISIGDRGVPPDVPIVPFRFPSGSLTVTVRAPSGHLTTLGPAPFVAARTKSIVDRRGISLGPVGGNLTEPYQLSTNDPRFEIEFDEQGHHVITVDASVEDIWGNGWHGGGTYELEVAAPLVIDSTTIPGTPFETGDALSSDVAIIPPVAADVEVRVTIGGAKRVVAGRANRFGRFHGAPIRLTEAGEYRVDIKATHTDASGRMSVGSRTFGGVVAPRSPLIVAHGQRGIDPMTGTPPQWFFRRDTGAPMGPTHVHFPFSSGDVAWLEKPDSVMPMVTFQDNGAGVLEKLRPLAYAYTFAPANDGEAPLFLARSDGFDPHLQPSKVDLWAYSYRSVQRPLMSVREEISDPAQIGQYWRFDEQFGAQPGIGANGDLPNDFKFQFGGAVLRGGVVGQPLYDIYASLFILVPMNDAGGGTRTFPPFQANGGGPPGGPLFTLKGKPIEIFFHPTAVRPGTILVQGDTASFAGYSAPTLPSKIAITVTSPSGRVRTIKGQANKIGWFHDSGYDFAVDEPGVWKARVSITFDGVLPSTSGQVEPPFPTGNVLGSRDGEFYFYVVRGGEAPLELASMPATVRPAEGPVNFRVLPPLGLTDVQVTYTTTMPGFVLEEGTTFNPLISYDAPRLAVDFPNLDLFDPNGFAGADTINISLLLSGTDAAGKRRHFARQVVIQGEELQVTDQGATAPAKRRRAAR